MINCENALILTNERIARDIFRMELFLPEMSVLCRAGQFANLYTGDSAMLLWVLLIGMGVAGAGMAIVLPGRKRKQEEI